MSDTPNLTNMQTLIMEVLAARHRLGESFWTFSSSPAMSRAMRALEAHGLVHWQSGNTEHSGRAELTNAGHARFLSARYAPPPARRDGNSDPTKEPVTSITAAWSLNDGSLYLIVRCADGVDRTVIRSTWC